MKYFKRIVLSLLIFLGLFYVLPAGLLQMPYFQKKISLWIADYLEEKIQTKVDIKQIELGLFNKLILKDVYIEDQAGETLLQAKRIAAGFEFFPLLKKRWRFNSFQIFTFEFNLSKETADTPLNIQYILDAFSKKNSTESKNPIDLQIKKLNLRRGSFSYREKNVSETSGQFNPKSFTINEISTKISFKNYTDNDEIRLIVKDLSFLEQSGLKVKNITFDLMANKEKAEIYRLLVELKSSTVLITDISVDYSVKNEQSPPLENIPFQLKIDNSDIYLNELRPFFPNLSEINEKISLKGGFSGTLNNFSISNLIFQCYDDLKIETNATIKNLLSSNPDAIYMDVKINELLLSPESIEQIVNNLSKNPFILPLQVKQMKDMRFTGEVSGFLNNLSANGALNTDVGTIITNITAGKNKNAFLRGKIASDSLDLAKLMNNNRFGKTIFDISIDATQQLDNQITGLIEGNIKKFRYNAYDYNNINLNGKFSSNSFNGFLKLDTPEGKVDAEGFFVIKENDAEFKFLAKISDLQPYKLNLTNKYKDLSLSLGINVDFTGNTPDKAFGNIILNDIRIKTEKETYTADTLTINSMQYDMEKVLKINSHILQGEIRGNYNFSALISDLKKSFASYLPAFKENKKSAEGKENTFSVDITVEDMSEISRIFSLPFTLHEQTQITGYYNSFYNKFNLEATVPWLTVGGSTIENATITLNNPDEAAQMKIEGISLQKKNNRLPFAIQINAADDKINTTFDWGKTLDKYRGKIGLTALFSKTEEKSPITSKIIINQSNMVFNDSIWTLYPTQIVADTSGIRINHLQAIHNEQFIKIDGAVSHNPEEKLFVELNEVDLEYIFNSLSIKALEFGGIATGYVNVQDIYKSRKLSTQLKVKDFSFNQAVFGNLDLTGKWDDLNQGVLMNGVVEKTNSKVDINGIIYPVKEEISINFDADNADARFLRKYLDKVVQDLTGSMSGHLRLFGDLNHPTVEGNVFAQNCRFGIEFLNTYYTFSDSVICLPDEIGIKNIKIFDEKGKSATANGYVKHNLFDDIRFSANISYDNFMVFNANKTLNPMFFGTAFGTGTANLYGTEDLINIDVTMQNTENTKISLNFMEETDILEYEFIHFISAKKDTVPTKTTQYATSTPVSSNNNQETEIRLNLILETTPQATIDIIMDPVSGDKISGYGNGSMQIQYGTKIPVRVFGTYRIDKGKYNFSLQQAIYRNFDIQEGSTVAFRGDPYIAELDISASNTVQAYLGDLDIQLVEQQQSAKSNIPVNCILKLRGSLDRPSIAFDINLPNSTEELNRQVKSYIRTEDMMNQQFVYLLVLSRFYTAPEYMREDSRANNNMSYLTSTLSSQLSNMLGSLSDKFQLGAKYHQSYENEQTNTEMELLLSSQLLNNRLIINGNFGYIDRPYLENNSNVPLIGDFDLEYLLTKNGDIRLKFFNHYNYRYLSPRPEMTQGLGVLFRKDFDRFRYLFKKKLKTNN
jgi:hypothetical protein